MSELPDNMEQRSAKVRTIAVSALFGAIIFLMTFTPIGFIHLLTIKATIVHIPVIIGSILLGPKIGAALGCMFGLASLINNTMAPALLSFVFSPLIPVPGLGRGSLWALVICFAPRILTGVVPYYVDLAIRSFREDDKKLRTVSLFVAGVSGSLTNTLLVMHLIYFVFRDAYAESLKRSVDAVYGLIVTVIATHGIPEALVAGLCVPAVVVAVNNYRGRKRRA